MKTRTIFLSHGAPTLPIEDVPASRFLRDLGAQTRRPRAILMVSAHWETEVPTVNAVEINDTIHDFRGFPPELYRLHYPAPGDPAIAQRIVELTSAAGLQARVDRTRGLDHGAWVPLILAFPDANIPVLQLSVQTKLGPQHHLRLGEALQPLTGEDVLIIGSGSFTHDLSSWRLGNEEPTWVSEFADWMNQAILEQRTQDLIDYRSNAPAAQRNHPTEEHLLPLFVAFGAAGSANGAELIHSSVEHGVLRMDAYRFG
jgi:4,5-DOPA dioxygenase extradiol